MSAITEMYISRLSWLTVRIRASSCFMEDSESDVSILIGLLAINSLETRTRICELPSTSTSCVIALLTIRSFWTQLNTDTNC